MSKIVTELTEEQKALLPMYREKWLKIGLDTNPVNRSEAEAAIKLVYECGGLPPPKNIIWLRSPFEGAIGAAILQNTVNDQIFVQIRDQIRDQIDTQIGYQIRDQIDTQIGYQIRDQICAQVGSQVWYQTWDQIGDQIRDQIWDQVGDKVRAQIRDQIWDQVRPQVWDQVGFQVWDQMRATGHGNHDSSWLGFYDFILNNLGLKIENKLQGLIALARNCGWFWPFENVVILTERPDTLKRDSQNRLHCEDGPALRYPDGYSLWKWHGVTVPESTIMNPSGITVSDIENERNSEVRRMMIDRYGPARYILDSGATVVQEFPADHELVGLRTARLLYKEVSEDEPIVYVDLLNSTPEPDGTIKRYQLRVDPNAYDGEASRNVQAAAASTWRSKSGELIFQDWRDYCPVAES